MSEPASQLLASIGTQHASVSISGPGAVPIVRSRILDEAGVPHAFSTRKGGVSRAYTRAEAPGELNLGFTASDPRENVLRNRACFLTEVFGTVPPMVTLRQVHAAAIHRVGLAEAAEEALLTGDGLLTDEPGVVLGIQTADCVPVLLADRKTGAVGAFHAGWRGTLARIVKQGVARMQAEYGSLPSNMAAVIGPAIGPCCYQVREEVETLFRAAFSHADALFTRASSADGDPERYSHLNLEAANHRQLLEAGVPASSIETPGLCTHCQRDWFFSYRADEGFTGRMLAVIARPSRG